MLLLVQRKPAANQLVGITLPLRSKWLHAILEINVGFSVYYEYLSVSN